MTRIAFITDTHLGCGEHGYKRQPRYLDDWPALMDTLRHWLTEMGVDLLAHGGDVTDDGTRPQIDQAIRLFQSFDTPTAICLGNHDLAHPDSIDIWRELGGSQVACQDQALLHVPLPHCEVLFITHHWHDDQAYYWSRDLPQEPYFDAQQEALIGEKLSTLRRPTILVSHAPAHAVPPEQTGLPEPVHLPHPAYRDSLQRITDQFPHLRLVLGGHNHIHSVSDLGSSMSCTTAAFGERPGELRLIDVDDHTIRVQTISLAALAKLPQTLAPDSAWVLGTKPQRTFTLPTSAQTVSQQPHTR